MTDTGMSDPDRPWRLTWPYGYPHAVASAGSVAAPLLAGFTITLIGIVIGYSQDIRWPGAALIVLSAAAVVLLLSVQAAFIARGWYVTPPEMLAWWPDPKERPGLDTLRIWQAEHEEKHRRWAAVFGRTYNLGLVLLLVGVACCLTPPAVDHGVQRWVACGILTAAAIAETAWIVWGWAGSLGTPLSTRIMISTGLVLPTPTSR